MVPGIPGQSGAQVMTKGTKKQRFRQKQAHLSFMDLWRKSSKFFQPSIIHGVLTVNIVSDMRRLSSADGLISHSYTIASNKV